VGDLIVTTSDDATAKIWRVDGTLLTTLTGHTDWVKWATFSPAGDLVVTVSDDGSAKIWGVDGTLQTTLMGQTSFAAFNPASDRIVTTHRDGTAKIWAMDGTLHAILVGHTGNVNSAVFNSTGEFIVTASTDGTARLWPTPIFMVREAHKRINRAFTEEECQQYFRDDPTTCPRTKEELFAPLAQYLTGS
jgi:WD40 repeat protein